MSEIINRELSEDITSADFLSESSGDETEAESLDQDATDAQRQLIVNYLKIDNDIRTKQEEIKQLKAQKKQFEGNLINTLEDDIGSIYLGNGNGSLRKNISSSKSPVTIQFITNILKNKLTDENLIKEIIDEIAKRPSKKRTYIKRVMARKK